MTVQTILIPRKIYSLKEAEKWIKDHGYKSSYYGKPVDITENYYRFRQKKPNSKFLYKTIRIQGGIKIVIANKSFL